eukprot:CAMPEP_0114579734 /NCGR_PEP_ID=MMETSP0125-20121206/4087_1 /TAXON_ID=485358 ORGANISM="Aristerostoma sp., Strain ATCC 50986" /NCGR_SAMPLE_ID=MMETSP0125 /ASSEMBLY_ACC=CAM_ASM_000245 /LENGTH=251 /DNA_ID=CAMNT_0001770727 /DNA_START=62 /DNA_END=813 /DNA_ORIENTATION=-
MALRKLFIGGNWKCNNSLVQTQDLVKNVYNKLDFDTNKVEVVCSPVFVHIPWVLQNVQSKVQVSAQNSSLTGYGAYTGEIAPQHLSDLGLKWVILGHSERRQYYNETDQVVANKTKYAIENNLSVILCIGESLEQREAGKTLDVVTSQLNAVKSQLSQDAWKNVVIAYEPIWAIGTGKTASPEQAEEVHVAIRNWISKDLSSNLAQTTRIIYGGSANEKNCKDLFAQKNIDGFLVGGASLKPAFNDIVNSA